MLFSSEPRCSWSPWHHPEPGASRHPSLRRALLLPSSGLVIEILPRRVRLKLPYCSPRAVSGISAGCWQADWPTCNSHPNFRRHGNLCRGKSPCPQDMVHIPKSIVRADAFIMYAVRRRCTFLRDASGLPRRGSFSQSKKDVWDFVQRAVFPVVLKGIDGARVARRTGDKMLIFHSARQLLDKYQSMEDPGSPNLMLQEYIPGDDDTI